MRLPVVLLVLSLLGILAGGWLTGRLGFGLAVIGVSLAVAGWALFHDDGAAQEPQVHEVPTLAQVLEKARRAG